MTTNRFNLINDEKIYKWTPQSGIGDLLSNDIKTEYIYYDLSGNEYVAVTQKDHKNGAIYKLKFGMENGFFEQLFWW